MLNVYKSIEISNNPPKTSTIPLEEVGQEIELKEVMSAHISRHIGSLGQARLLWRQK